MDETWSHRFPRGDATSGRLSFENGVAPRLQVRGAALGDELARCAFRDPAPRVAVEDGELRIDYRGFFRWLFSGGLQPGLVELNDELPWSVNVLGGVAKAELDLRRVRLQRLDVTGGAAKVELRLGKPEGIVPLRVTGGAAKIALTHPVGVGVRLRVGGGATRVRLDDQALGAVGGGLTLTSPSWNEKGDGFDIKIGGGAAGVDVQEEGKA